MIDLIRRKIFILLLIVALVFNHGLATMACASRVKRIIVYPYRDSGNGFSFENFLVFLDTNTLNLIDELEADAEIEIKKLQKHSDKNILSKKDMAKIWNNNSNIIEILSGTITENPTKTGYTILSRIYSELFSPISKRKQVPLQEDSSKHTTKDFLSSHHVALLYLLAMEAKNSGQPSWVVVHLLNKAQGLGSQIDFSNSSAAEKLIEQINNELKLQEQSHQ